MAKADSSYAKFVVMQSHGVFQPYAFQIFTTPKFQGVECALWPSLYHSLHRPLRKYHSWTNQPSEWEGSFLYKVLSPVLDVTKMHQAATVEGLYCTDITGFQAANSFLRSVRPLAPEMAFQLSNMKAAWTDKQTKQFRAPHPGQEEAKKDYVQYLK